ncbi:MAG: glycosyltransferase family 4 protein [Spirulinaceae cyanobacterium RM2_2_10]|nr:glycosyltransferase family 4 protein [Spirulinaceae cyanobacterium SM2_1_0]NJO19702.1 glycosyltransferase family 4 protein [Spirulinaceae cyanobacterium RM2_2_10]
MTEPLKILMVLHMPWQRNLGAGRVQLELAEEFRQLGHQVEKFDSEDAAAQHARSGQGKKFNFVEQAIAHVRAYGHRFDIIDAHQGNLPTTKASLNFSGLLVARSVALYALYDQFSRSRAARLPAWKLRARYANAVGLWRDRRNTPNYVRSLQACDLINLPNQEEYAYVRDRLHLGDKCVVFPFGLSPARRAALQAAARSPGDRLAQPKLVFIGTWSRRKGANDWPALIRTLKQQVPTLRCCFLGTGLSAATVLSELRQPAGDWLEIMPHYDSADLPQLLSEATVGAFPSYVEGFGFAVLEKLAAGVPTVAYDAAGPREMLQFLPDSLRVPIGDWRQMAAQLVQLLQQLPTAYGQLSQDCQAIAARFCWRDIAIATLTAYHQTPVTGQPED